MVKFFIIPAILLLVGCNGAVRDLRFHFKSAPLIYAEPQLITINNALFGMPFEMINFDTVLIIRDDFRDKNFSLIDVRNRRLISRFGTKGEGPNEIMHPTNININYTDGYLEFTTITPRRHVKISLENILKPKSGFDLVTQSFAVLEEFPFNIIWFPGMEKYIATGMFNEGKYLTICPVSGAQEFIGNYPNSSFKGNIENRLLGDVYQGFMRLRPDGQMVAKITLSCDLIEVIDSNGNITRFQTYNPEIAVIDGMVARSRNSLYGFSSIAVTSRFIYVLFSGRTFIDYGMSAQFGNMVYVFDWGLNPIRSYSLPLDALSIGVTQCDSKLYFLGMGDLEMELFEVALQTSDLK